MITNVSVAAFILSLGANAYFAFLFHRRKKDPEYGYDARALLHDLSAGHAALIKVERVDPRDVLLRSPRDLG